MTGSSNSQIVFSKAEEKDIDRIEEIYRNTVRKEAESVSYTGWVEGVYPTRTTAYAALQRGDLYVGKDNGTIVGTAVFNKIQLDCYRDAGWDHDCSDDTVMVMHTLAIDPAFRGAGYGSAFVRFYESISAENGCHELRIDTQERNLPARAMYKKLGFREVCTVPCVFNGIPDVRLVLLEKYIT